MQQYYAAIIGNALLSATSKSESKKVSAETPEEALTLILKEYDKPKGIYSIDIYANALACSLKQRPLLRWLSDKAKFREQGAVCPVCGQNTEVYTLDCQPGVDEHRCKNPACKNIFPVDQETGAIR